MEGESARPTRAKTVRKRAPDTTTLISEESRKERAQAAYLERRSKAQSMAEKLAGHSFHYRNWYYPGGQARFPHDPKLHFVDKMFPLAEGGMLLIDEPNYVWEFERCEKKKQIMRELGHRYVAIMPKMTFDELMMELENGMDYKSRGSSPSTL